MSKSSRQKRIEELRAKELAKCTKEIEKIAGLCAEIGWIRTK